MELIRECSRQGIRTPCPHSKIARRRAYFYDYKGIMTQKPTLKFTHTERFPSPKGVPDRARSPKSCAGGHTPTIVRVYDAGIGGRNCAPMGMFPYLL